MGKGVIRVGFARVMENHSVGLPSSLRGQKRHKEVKTKHDTSTECAGITNDS